jgi:TonB family protein
MQNGLTIAARKAFNMMAAALLLPIIVAQATKCHATPVILVKEASMSDYDSPTTDSGHVILSVVVDERGVVRAVYVRKSSGFVSFDRAALQSAGKSIYKPATKNCKPVKGMYSFGMYWASTY